MKYSDILVSIVTFVCVLTIARLTNNLLSAIFGPVVLLVVYFITKDKIEKSKICSNPLFWSLVIVLITLAILVVYFL